jgi:rare lipoprotein A
VNGWQWLLLLGILILGTVVLIGSPHYYQVGVASWYGPGFQGKPTANGELYDMYSFTAAHKTLPFGTVVKVVDLETGRSVVVRINDRGPFVPGRIIDLSYAAAEALGMVEKGTAKVGLVILSWP